MRRLTILLFTCATCYGQFTVTTVAGSLATATSGLGGGIARDAAGNTYLCRGSIISRMDPTGKITTFAGTGVPGYSGDGGPAIAAQFLGAGYCAVDPNGNLVVVDLGNRRIRRIDAAGIVRTIAGTGVAGYLGNGDPGPTA